MEENQGIPRIEAWPIEGLEMECPECHRIVQELEEYGDSEGEKVCPFCDTLFFYSISQE